MAVEGTAFWSEVADACLDVGVTRVPPRAMFTNGVHPDMHILEYVAQITCICFAYVLGVVWVLRTVEIELV